MPTLGALLSLIPLQQRSTTAVLLLLLIAAFLYGMRTRRFYLVRHGQTVLNAAHIKQGEDGALSEKGRFQALRVAKSLKLLGIHTILTSPYPRALETAHILSREMHASVRSTRLLSERRNPSAVIGLPTDDPSVVRATDSIDLSYHSDTFRYADEENFSDIKIRARQCLRYLVRHSATRTCVVTHHAFLKMLLAYMLYGRNLHEPALVTLAFLNTSDNGGISVAEYSPWKRFSKTGGWKVLSYNEQLEQ